MIGQQATADRAECARRNAPKVSVILPCRGRDPGFLDNLRAVLDQDYPGDFEVVFCTTADDDALPDLMAMAKREKRRPVRVVTAGTSSHCAQKLHNQLAALDTLHPDRDVFVFVDSDARPHRSFLRDLVAPLAEKHVGATTGFRWYLPGTNAWASYMRSTWNMGALPFLGHGGLGLMWGGAMAVRRATFLACGVRERWAKALSDDFSLGNAVEDHGLLIRFVPRCLALCHEDCTWRALLEWTNRQCAISRVYAPRLWRLGAIAIGAAWVLTAALIATGGWLGWWGAALGLASLAYLLPVLTTLALFPAIESMLSVSGGAERFRRARWRYAILAPLAAQLYGLNLLRSLWSRRIVWRGIGYEMISPTKTRILSMDAPRSGPETIRELNHPSLRHVNLTRIPRRTKEQW